MFDTKSFKKAKFEYRTDEVAVPDLKAWFKKGAKAVWEVRGLSGKEVGANKMAASKNKSLAGLLKMLQAADISEKTDAMEAILDLGKDRITDDIAERLERMVTGSVKPKCDIDLALKVCENFPVDFFNITNKILKLTGLGMMPGELKGCGKART